MPPLPGPEAFTGEGHEGRLHETLDVLNKETNGLATRILELEEIKTEQGTLIEQLTEQLSQLQAQVDAMPEISVKTVDIAEADIVQDNTINHGLNSDVVLVTPLVDTTPGNPPFVVRIDKNSIGVSSLTAAMTSDLRVNIVSIKT